VSSSTDCAPKKISTDLPVAIVCVPARRAHGKVPPR
jgi:hypothetical protein